MFNIRNRKIKIKVWQPLGGAVAKNMGIKLAAFEKKLYEKSIHGDWSVYEDDAKKFKWVDVVIAGVDDATLHISPDAAYYTWEKYSKKYYHATTEDGATLSREEQAYARLNPHDFNYAYYPRR